MRLAPLLPLRAALLLVLPACADPELEPYRRALDAYRAGRTALEGGDGATAAEHFARAAALDESSASLPAWQARALEAAGRRVEALAVLDGALERLPMESTLRYNRAALRARDGDLDGAARDLRVLVDRGLVDPREAAADPDFAPLLEHAAAAGLVQEWTLHLEVRGETGAVLLGDRWTLELALTAPVDAEIVVEDGGSPLDLLRLERVVEDGEPAGAGMVRRRLAVSWRAVGAGEGTLGPWQVSAAGRSVGVPGMPVEVVGVPGRAPEGTPASRWSWLPSARLGARAPLWSGQDGGDLAWVGPPGSRSRTVGLSTAISVELRRDGQTEWVGEIFVDAADASLTVWRGRERLLPAP